MKIIKYLHTDLIQLEKWSDKWQMQFNISKCVHLPITNKTKPSSHQYSLFVHTLYKVASHAYLGVKLDSKLSWAKPVVYPGGFWLPGPPASAIIFFKSTCISVPLVDHLLVELETRFSPHHRVVLIGLCLVGPTFGVGYPIPDPGVKSHLVKMVDLYEEDLA